MPFFGPKFCFFCKKLPVTFQNPVRFFFRSFLFASFTLFWSQLCYRNFAISDAPRADEIVVVLGGATGGRPHHRIGDRYQDLKDLGHDLDNPAGV